MAESKAKDVTKKPTQADIDAGLALLAKKIERQEKIARGEIKGDVKWADMTPEQKAKAKEQSRRYTAKTSIMMAKAKAAGITVSDAEIDAHLAAKGK